MIESIEIFIKLMLAMAVTDLAIQTEVMAFAKGDTKPTVVQDPPWYYFMGAHSMVNGCGVWLVTGNVYFGVAESVLHFVIDHLKCSHIISSRVDLTLHIGCRVIYAVIWKLIGG